MNRWPDSVARKIRAPAEWAEWRSGAGPQVALVVGSFDLLHPGNLSLLIRARQIAPRTVVLLQPDPPPAGRAGPLSHPLAERVEFLAHLHLVDLISTWPGPGPDPLAALRPFRWITAESHVDTEPGHDWIRREAEAVVRHPDQPGCFTADIHAALKAGATPIPRPPFYADLPPPPPPVPPAAGHRRVTVNGCFDILHIGHLRLLRQAAEKGDELFVLINSDHSVRRYKGPSRPVFHEACRRAALQAVAGIREVLIFDEDKPLDLIAALQPAIHVKGGTFEPDRVREEEACLARWGGAVAFCPLVEGYSSTAIIRRILETPANRG